MTAIRQSFLFELEDYFGKPNATHHWIAPPPGSFINTTHNRGTTRVQSAGTKVWDTVAYGQLTGSWEWTFMLDYDYLEPLYFAFESLIEYECTGTAQNPTVTNNYTDHKYDKSNTGRVRSFTIRRKMLNRMAGGPENSDEMEEIYGCVVRNISFSKAAGDSQIQVRMTGFFVDEAMVLGRLDATDYQEYDGHLAEYFCMFVGDNPTDTLSQCHYVANTESLEISIENGADPIYNTCSPFASAYYENITNYSFSTSCYSNNPNNYKLRVYGGGRKVEPVTDIDGTRYISRPMAKGLAPMKKIYLIAYDGSARSYDTTSEGTTTHVEDTDITSADIIAAYNRSTKKICVDITDCVIKSLTWPKGDGSKITDNISSTECKRIKMTITNPKYVANPGLYANQGTGTDTAVVKHRDIATASVEPEWYTPPN